MWLVKRGDEKYDEVYVNLKSGDKNVLVTRWC
jgi:hypothetical protein